MSGESFQQQLLRDSWFLRVNRRVDSRLLDKLIQELKRSSPQILTDTEAHTLMLLDVPTCIRLDELLTRLHGKGEVACYQLYRALHLHGEDVYFSLPTRAARSGSTKSKQNNKSTPPHIRFVLNDRGPWFFFTCFGLAVGGALMYYHHESLSLGDGARAVLAYAGLDLSRPASSFLLLYAENTAKKH